MRPNKFIAPAFALTAIMGAGTAFAQYGQQPQGPPPGYQQQGPPPNYQGGPPQWDAPPPEFREYQSKGYHDGVVGATKDYENHRPPTPENRDEFRHPSFIPRPFRRDYKDGFRKGYFAAVQHLQGGPGPYQGPR